MASIFDIFASQLDERQLDQIAKQLGADRGQTKDAISMSLPALVEALGRRVEQQGGAEEIHQRLEQSSRRSGGSMLDMLNETIAAAEGGSTRSTTTRPSSRVEDSTDDILPPTSAPRTSSPPQPRTAPKPASTNRPTTDIFGELLGEKRGRVADAVSKSSGLNPDQTGSLISMLGPILAEVLGSETTQKKMSPSDLSEMLKRDRARVQQAPGGSMVSMMLDQDGDGDFDMNDMMKLGMGMLFKK